MRKSRQAWCRSTIAEAFLGMLASLVLTSSLWAASGTYKVLHAFGKNNDGSALFDSVVFDAKGNLFGTTWGGGAYDSGTVFRLAPAHSGRWIVTTLYSFCRLPRCADGALPFAGLAVDAGDNLFGATNGTIFELSPSSWSANGWSFLVIVNSGSGSSLTLDRAGNLYGPIGPGKYGKGAVTELSPASGGWTETYLHSFCPKPLLHCPDGDVPDSMLTWDSSGNLYGTTEQGGKGQGGVAFELEPVSGGWQEHVLHSFPDSPSDGYPTSSGLALDGAGNLYGTTLAGGGKGCQGGGCGTVFQLTRDADGRWKETILYRFPKLKDGAGPSGGLAIDKAGNLYGISGGGTGPCGGGGCGVVFKMSPPKPGSGGKWTHTVLHRFTGPDGALPVAGPILDKRGNLYGTTSVGGAAGAGVVFEITP